MGDSYYSQLRKVENSLRELNQDVEERNRVFFAQGSTAKVFITFWPIY